MHSFLFVLLCLSKDYKRGFFFSKLSELIDVNEPWANIAVFGGHCVQKSHVIINLFLVS